MFNWTPRNPWMCIAGGGTTRDGAKSPGCHDCWALHGLGSGFIYTSHTWGIMGWVQISSLRGFSNSKDGRGINHLRNSCE